MTSVILKKYNRQFQDGAFKYQIMYVEDIDFEYYKGVLATAGSTASPEIADAFKFPFNTVLERELIKLIVTQESEGVNKDYENEVLSTECGCEDDFYTVLVEVIVVDL